MLIRTYRDCVHSSVYMVSRPESNILICNRRIHIYFQMCIMCSVELVQVCLFVYT